MERYLVGGAVRDQLLGLPVKDFDYVVVAPSFDAMRTEFLKLGGKIWQERPEYFTIRGKLDGVDADFVLARRDGEYTDGRRPDSVAVGTLFDDLSRRDFTINAMARGMDGVLIDYFHGFADLENNLLRTVGDPIERFREDGLRVLRALRFMVTKDMIPDEDLFVTLHRQETSDLLADVHVDRVREELGRMLKHDTPKTLRLLSDFPRVNSAIWRDHLHLEVSLKRG